MTDLLTRDSIEIFKHSMKKLKQLKLNKYFGRFGVYLFTSPLPSLPEDIFFIDDDEIDSLQNKINLNNPNTPFKNFIKVEYFRIPTLWKSIIFVLIEDKIFQDIEFTKCISEDADYKKEWEEAVKIVANKETMFTNIVYIITKATKKYPNGFYTYFQIDDYINYERFLKRGNKLKKIIINILTDELSYNGKRKSSNNCIYKVNMIQGLKTVTIIHDPYSLLYLAKSVVDRENLPKDKLPKLLR